MSEIAWTDEELTEFERLAILASRPRRDGGIKGQLDMDNFVKTHGKEKCDAMWIYLLKQAME